jgi:hypothetical protein
MGWTCLDLKSAQLAIAAREWNVKSIQDLLKGGKDIWAYLQSKVDVSKPILKTAIYSIVFGANVKKARGGSPKKLFLENGYSMEIYKSFLEIDVIKDLINARDEQLKVIENNVGAPNAFDRVIACNAIDSNGDIVNSRSVLAQVMQSHEAQLIIKVIEILDTSSAVLTLLIHDGIAVKIRNGKGQKAIEACNDAFLEMQTFTSLEWE